MANQMTEAEQAALDDCYQSFRALCTLLEMNGRNTRMIAAAVVAVMWEAVDRLPVPPRLQLLQHMAEELNERLTVIENLPPEDRVCGRIH